MDYQLSFKEIYMVNWIQIQDKAEFHFILMFLGKAWFHLSIVVQTGLFSLGVATNLGEGKLISNQLYFT